MAETKVSAQDIVALSEKGGFLAKQLYVAFTTPTDGIGPVMENIMLGNIRTQTLRAFTTSEMEKILATVP